VLRIATTHLWVHDQDVALDFWTAKVGMEVRSDVTVAEMGNFRWLTVGVPGQPEVSIVLMAVPGPPMTDESTSRQIADLVGKGFAGTVFLTTDDCQAAYEELAAKGVEFTSLPERQMYGVGCGFRDPSGNSIRLTQLDEDFG